jgi:hypothetical protein
MTDHDYRLAETRGTPAQVLAHRLRAGLDPRRVELAARLGDAASLEHYPEAVQIDWSAWQERRDALAAACAIDNTLPARLAADWAERALPAWAVHSSSDAPRGAIAAARAWVACPCAEHRDDAAAAAASAAYAAGYAAAADSAASAATSAAYATYAYAYAGYNAAHAAHAATYAAHAAAADAAAERAWQVALFVAVLLT